MTGKESIHTQGSRRVLWRNGNPNTVTIARRVWATDQFYPSNCRLIHLRVKSLTRWLLLGYELWRTSQPRSRFPLLPGPWERGWTNQNCYVINGTVFRVASCADPLWDCVTSPKNVCEGGYVQEKSQRALQPWRGGRGKLENCKQPTILTRSRSWRRRDCSGRNLIINILPRWLRLLVRGSGLGSNADYFI